MTRKKKLVLAVVIAVAAAAAVLAVMMRPRSFAESADFDPEQGQSMHVILSDTTGRTDAIRYQLTPEDSGYWDVIELLDQHSYRYARPYPSRTSSGHIPRLDYHIELGLISENSESFLSFFGIRTVNFFSHRPISAFVIVGLDEEESLAFQQTLLDLLLELAPEEG